MRRASELADESLPSGSSATSKTWYDSCAGSRTISKERLQLSDSRSIKIAPGPIHGQLESDRLGRQFNEISATDGRETNLRDRRTGAGYYPPVSEERSGTAPATFAASMSRTGGRPNIRPYSRVNCCTLS